MKEIFRIAGIKKHITWHMSRHTYATEICLNNGMPIESLKKTMGHKRISTTERYARVIAEKVSKDMGNLSTVLQTNGQFKYAKISVCLFVFRMVFQKLVNITCAVKYFSTDAIKRDFPFHSIGLQ